MASDTTVVKCAKCSTVINDAPDVPVADRTLCPTCGSTARLFEVEIRETSVLRDSRGMKARHGGAGRPFFEAKEGANLHRKSGRWMQRDLVIDRDNDRYLERVVDPETGAVIHECEEPLSQHQRHGTAKRKGNANDG
jgi:hypothetical protein